MGGSALQRTLRSLSGKPIAHSTATWHGNKYGVDIVNDPAWEGVRLMSGLQKYNIQPVMEAMQYYDGLDRDIATQRNNRKRAERDGDKAQMAKSDAAILNLKKQQGEVDQWIYTLIASPSERQPGGGYGFGLKMPPLEAK